jgi:hypothetical protein
MYNASDIIHFLTSLLRNYLVYTSYTLHTFPFLFVTTRCELLPLKTLYQPTTSQPYNQPYNHRKQDTLI